MNVISEARRFELYQTYKIYRRFKSNTYYFKECKQCGKQFISKLETTKHCSEKCRKKNVNRNKETRYKNITVDDDITLDKLCKRDNYKCAICGGLVDLSDSKVIDGTIICGNTYPSIDHIVPVSKGGLHEWSNIQLAHRVCNSKKGNRFVTLPSPLQIQKAF